MDKKNQMNNLNVYAKLSLARVNLMAVNLNKSGHNTYAGFKYFELSDFLPHVNKIFHEVGLLSVFSIKPSEGAVLDIIDQSSGEKVSFSCEASSVLEQDPTQQGKKSQINNLQYIGCVNTYMKRYLFLNALEIIENDIVDASIGEDDPDEVKLTKLNKQYELMRNMNKSLGARLNPHTGKFQLQSKDINDE